ncbi:hypothetical protein GWD52_11595 [Enterobacteriaceae bacterium 4M9]|nr:hypothetical protein [Enterobacteriaceae bacterium 4M9]
MRIIEQIKEWVSKKKLFYFFLPNGPYGRPFDNQYLIKEVLYIDGALEIAFQEGLSLVFEGDLDILDEGCNLKIFNFTLCRLEEHKQLLQSFNYGEVMLSGF